MLGVRESGISLRLSSTREFKERLGEVRDSFRPRGRARCVLVIQAGNHPHNSRHVPVPSFVPMEVDLSSLAEGYGRHIGGEVWFRAEVDPAGKVDKIIILESSVPVAEQYLHDAIREQLEVRHGTEKRHRVVVFAFGRVDGEKNAPRRAPSPPARPVLSTGDEQARPSPLPVRRAERSR
ncbi:MAG TPA: hypothetical protein VF121_12260 [Thermoanaerobaculia bacterium]|nr:hypothetical protein [Thermoanaerobaculia bacterium]